MAVVHRQDGVSYSPSPDIAGRKQVPVLESTYRRDDVFDSGTRGSIRMSVQVFRRCDRFLHVELGVTVFRGQRIRSRPCLHSE